MGEYLQQIGVAGILVILILDRVFAFLTKQRNGKEEHRSGDAGAQSTDYWRQANRDAAQEALDASAVPILKQLADILGRLELRGAQTYEMEMRQGFQIEETQKSLERLRASAHVTNEHLQRIVTKVSAAE